MSWLKSPLSQIIAFALVLAILWPIALFFAAPAKSAVASTLLTFIGLYAIPITLVHWMAADMRSRGRTPPYELPFFLMLVWPISLFWYCAWTRGQQGLLLAFGLYCLGYVPIVSAMVMVTAWVLMTEQAP